MFKPGESYILARKLISELDAADTVMCTQIGAYSAEFYSMKNNVKFQVFRTDFGHIHEIISNEQFKDKSFCLGDTLYSYKFYDKIIAIAGGELKPYATKETNYFITEKSSKQTSNSKKARTYRVKKITETEFWKMYYQE